MNSFDRYVKNKIAEEKTEIPETMKLKIEEILNDLPEKSTGHKNSYYRFRRFAVAACVLLVFFFLMPNVSVSYAQAMEQIPILGELVKVVTIRNYFYSDENHEMNIQVPQIEGNNQESVDYINTDVERLTTILKDRFYEELESVGGQGHSSTYVDYETVTNTDNWFTLRMIVFEAAGSSNTYYKYYHINKRDGEIVQLEDFVTGEGFYDVVSDEIKRQMKAEMEADQDKIYWLEGSAFGWDFVELTPNHNFYWNEEGNLVIPFDKYEVAPGYMGTPEFVIEKGLIQDWIKPEYGI